MKLFSYFEITSIAGSAIIIGGSFYLAHHFEDPYIVRRGGAALVLYSLLLALRAHRLDETKDSLADKTGIPPVPDFARPERKMVREVEDDLREQRRSIVSHTVSRIFLVHLIMAGVGELMHGFGDLAYIGLFGSAARAH